MKVIHIVIAKFKPEITELAKEAALKDILALKNSIPVIKDISAGKNFTDKGKGYEYGWVIEFENKEGLAIYTDHEDHQAYIKKHRPGVEDLITIDYEL